jgi:PST family polysaccharide transporter
MPSPDGAYGSSRRSTSVVSALKRTALRGVLWSYVSFGSGRVLNFVATLILARLLVPAEFGVFAFAMAIAAYLDVLRDLGVGASIIYRSDAREPRVASTAFWLSLGSALVLTALAWALVPVVRSLGPDPLAGWVLAVLSLQLIMGALGGTHQNLLMNSMEFRKLLWPEFLSGVVKGVLSVALALAGLGVWSLVVGQLAGSAARTVTLWRVSSWRPSLTFARSEVSSMIGFGVAFASLSLLGQASATLDTIFVGVRMDAEAVGILSIAYFLPVIVVVATSQPIHRVLFPFFARVHDSESGRFGPDSDLARTCLRTVRFGSLVVSPLGVGLAGLAVPLTATLYGDRWSAVAVPMAILGVWAALNGIYGMPGSILKSLGRSWLMTGNALVYMAISIPATWIGAGIGLWAVTLAHLLAQLIALLVQSGILSRDFGIPWWPTLTNAAPGFLLALPVGIALYLLSRALPAAAALALRRLAGAVHLG